jgi:hypothetical protein
MNNIITNLDKFVNEEFLGIGKDREYDPDDYNEFLNFKNFINTVNKHPQFAKTTKNGIKFGETFIEKTEDGILVKNAGIFIKRESDLYNKALKLLHSAVQTIKNDFKEIKYI